MALTEIIPDGRSLPVPSYPPDPLMFSFFIPCYNEERNVASVIEKLVRVCTTQNVSFEILVFDDCSRDRTVDVVRACQGAHPGVPVRLFVNATNQGSRAISLKALSRPAAPTTGS